MFTMLYVAMASGWNIIGGYAGYTSPGHNVFYAVGAYLSGMLFIYLGVSPFVTFPLAGSFSWKREQRSSYTSLMLSRE